MEEVRDIWPLSDIPSKDISIYDGPDVFVEDFAVASPMLRTTFAAYWLQAEILNGGLLQFFSNDTGVLAPEAVEACRTLGLPKLADTLQEAMSWFGTSYPRERTAREMALADREDPFALLDERIVALIYEEGAGLEQAAVFYVTKHGS